MTTMQTDGTRVGAVSAMRLTDDIKKALVAYAEGAVLGEVIEEHLDHLLSSYIDGGLDDQDASVLGALMRANADVARLVADETRMRQRLRRHLSFLFGELDAEESADVQHLIKTDPDVAKMNRELLEIANRIGAAIEPSGDTPLPPDRAAAIHAYLTVPAPEAAPIDHYGTLLVYAAGMPLDSDLQLAVDGMIDDYLDDKLDDQVSRDLETLMRLFASVARLVADRAEQAKLDLRVALFLDGRLDAEESAEVRRLIRHDPEVALLAHEFRRVMDLEKAIARPILDRPRRRQSATPGRTEPMPRRAAEDLATLVVYAQGQTIDASRREAWDRLISSYIGGELDSAIACIFEAAMRLYPSVARMIADRTEATCGQR